MATRMLVPIREYLRTSYSPDCDYVDGTIVERNLGEQDHSTVHMAVSANLFNRRDKLGIHVFPEQRIQVSPTRFRVPDICVTVGPKPVEQVFTKPPFLCIEILSPEDRMAAIEQRIDDYLAFGVRYVWLISPQTRKAYIYTREGRREVKDGVLRTKAPDIEVPLEEVFRGL